jgi:hypothetical protein
MTQDEPKFVKSKYFVNEPGNWHLKPGAPDDVRKEFREFMAAQQQSQPPDKIIITEKDLDL